MRITNNYYDEVIYRYSRTAEALRAEASGKFDSVLAEAQSRPTPGVGQDTLLASAAQSFSRSEAVPDLVLASSARRFAHSTQTTGYDSLLRNAAKKYGASTCV